MNLFVGIDCGLDGAIAVISDDEVAFFDTPTLATGHGNRRAYDVGRMASILRGFTIDPTENITVKMIALETQQAMPPVLRGRRQGTTSSFTTGVGFGAWQGVIAGVGYPFELVHPLRWKKAMMPNAPKEKDASVLFASRLFPKWADKLTTERGRALHGRADALLLAEYMRRQSGATP